MALIIIVVAIAGIMASILCFTVGIHVGGLTVNKTKEPNSNWIHLSP